MNILNIFFKKLYFFTSPNLLYNYGTDALKLKLFKLAAFYFKLAIEKNPQKYNAFYNLALAEHFLNNDNEACSNYKKYLEHKPQDIDAVINYSISLRSIKKYDKAIEILNQLYNAIYDTQILFQIGICHIEAKNFAGLINHVKNIFDLDIKYAPTITINLAKYAYEMNVSLTDFTFVKMTIALLSILLGIKFKNFEIYLLFSSCYAKMADWKLAAAYCSMALDFNPKSTRALRLMGMILYCNAEYKKALIRYLRAERLKFFNDAKLYIDIALTFEILGNKNMMKLYLCKALFLHPIFSNKKQIFERLFI